ncbi:MAG TPA: DUF167 domain-containing protein [Rubrobacteraceae bacterium]|nr:DUF167 domain-containing protein [Rubrobacteraceae bacterium]
MAEVSATVGTRAGSEDFVRPAKEGVYVKLRVSPGAKSTRIKGLYGEGAVRLSVTAPPTGGRANGEIERYLARLLEVPRSDITVVKGVQRRDKLVFVHGFGADEVRTRLDDLL